MFQFFSKMLKITFFPKSSMSALQSGGSLALTPVSSGKVCVLRRKIGQPKKNQQPYIGRQKKSLIIEILYENKTKNKD